VSRSSLFSPRLLTAAGVSLTAFLLLTGCGSREESPPATSTTQINAEMQKVQANQNMPPQARASVLATMERAKSRGQSGARPAP
jgi:outer membrane biogenesis lipoprotein LolB